MLRWLLARLPGWLGGDNESANDAEDAHSEDTEPEDSNGFVRSRLDANVVTAHGDGNPEAERELADVAEQARTLEEGREG